MFFSQISFGTTTLFLLVAVILLVSPRGESNKSVIETEIEVSYISRAYCQLEF
jgi:hypothetical protein|tara:strand:- start:367 stop:525 length:159 start_codon:yes stop_codon:yes gene_type:complete